MLETINIKSINFQPTVTETENTSQQGEDTISETVEVKLDEVEAQQESSSSSPVVGNSSESDDIETKTEGSKETTEEEES